MAITTKKESLEKSNDVWVGMGDSVVVKSPGYAKTVLGSCIGLALYSPEKQLAAVAHIVLPTAEKRSGPKGKFADSAVPHMLSLLAKHNVKKDELIAKIAGGSRMLGGQGPFQIGESNYRVIHQALEEHNIPITGKSVGGDKGRRISFNPKNGSYEVEIAGNKPICI